MGPILPESKQLPLGPAATIPGPTTRAVAGPGAPAPMCHAGCVLHLRPAGIGDLAAVLPRTLALNAHEGIAVDPPVLEAALDRLLRDPTLGGVWLVERDGAVIGYAMVTFG